MDKKTLRKLIQEKKSGMSPQQILGASLRLAELLLQHPLYQQAETIYGYLPINQEVRTEGILLRAMNDGKRIALPKIAGDEMRFFYMDDLAYAKKGYAGILEPPADARLAEETAALVLVPGLAFDKTGNRVGYGKGFYDRFFAKEPKHPKLAVCYDFQIVDRLEADEFDVPVDAVLWA